MGSTIVWLWRNCRTVTITIINT